MGQLRLGKKYIFTFIGEGVVKSFETTYTNDKGKMYGYFDCGMDIRLEYVILNSVENYCYFNITEPKMEKYINCQLYIFDSLNKMQEILPKIVNKTIKEISEKSETMMVEIMKMADDCSFMEQQKNKLEKKEFKLTSPFE